MSANRCPLVGVCGGCQYTTLPYAEQLELKDGLVRELLERYAIDQKVYSGIEACPGRFAYRNKMEYTFGDTEKGGPMSLGLHRQRSYMSILTADQCQLVPDDFNALVRATLDFCNERHYSFYHKKSHRGLLRWLVLRHGVRTGELLIHIVTSSQGDFAATEFAEMVQQIPLENMIAGILHSVDDKPADTVAADQTELLYGRPFYHEQLLDLQFEVGPFSFFQTNVLAAERLYDYALSLVSDLAGQNVFDLYSGTGTISMLAARRAKQVTGVEIVPEAVAAARRGAVENQLANCRFIEGDVLKILDELIEKPDLIILDPPRSGVHPKAWSKILAYGVPQILYISCNPKTALSDVAAARGQSYRPLSIRAFDNFPGTRHVEAVVLMSRKI